MDKDLKEKFEKLALINKRPILVHVSDDYVFENSVYLPSDCDDDELNGFRKGFQYIPPKWLELVFNNVKYLIIDKIDAIEKEEQLKFMDLLKYRKVSTSGLPVDTVIVITYDNLLINEQIYDIVDHIK